MLSPFITFRSSSSSSITIAGTGPVSVALPSGVVNGDILIAVAGANTGTVGGWTTPSGWTSVTGNIQVNGVDANNQFLNVFWKRASGETGPYSFDWSGTATDGAQVTISAYYNCVATGSPIDVFSTNTDVSPNGDTSIGLSVTTTVANTMLLFAQSNEQGQNFGTPRSPPSGMTERIDDYVYMAEEARPSAGATGNRSHANSGQLNRAWCASLVALKPIESIIATVAALEAPDTALITVSSTYFGPLAATEAPDVALISAATQWNAALAATEAPDTALIQGAARWNAALAATEAPDAALITAGTSWNVVIAASEAPDIVLIGSTARWEAALAATEAPDVALIQGADRWNVAIAASEAPDTALINATVADAGTIAGSLNALEAPDAALIVGAVTGIAGRLTATEAPDTALIQATTRWNAALAATEASDIALVVGAVSGGPITVTIAASEAPDTALITGSLPLGSLVYWPRARRAIPPSS